MGRRLLILTALLFATSPVAAQVAPAQFLRCWQKAQEGESIWTGFAEVHTKHELAGVAKLLIAIEHLRDGGEDADKRFNFPAPPKDQGDYIADRLAFAGRSWRARMQMVDLSAKLKAHHRKRVEYPPTLEALVEAGFAEKADIVDPFGRPFNYQVGPRALIPDVPRQVFKLSCEPTGVSSRAMSKTLEKLYAPYVDVDLSSLRAHQREAYVRFRQPDGSLSGVRRWLPGQKQDALMLVAVYDRFIVLFAADVPKVVALP